MNFQTTETNVDAGIIMVADIAYLKDHPCKADPSETGDVFEVPNGKYRVRWRIPNTCNGSIRGENTLTVTSGKIFVSDPCYLIGHEHQQWLDWLEKTDYANELNDKRAFIIDEMGGDGGYRVYLHLIKLMKDI